MRFDGGWVRINRNIASIDKQNNPFFGDAVLGYLWVCLIIIANYKEGKTRCGNNLKPVLRGQIVTSLDELSEMVGASKKIIRNRLLTLENWECIRYEGGNAGSLITILNYDKYQDIDKTREREGNAEVTQRERRGNAEGTIVNKVTREQENNETIRSKPTRRQKPPLILTPSEISVSTDWLKYQQEVQPSTQSTIQSIGEDLAKIKRVVTITDANGQKQKLTDDHMRGILDFLRCDEFWRDKASSTKTLLTRRHKGGPRKIDNILGEIRKHVNKQQKQNTYMRNPLED